MRFGMIHFCLFVIETNLNVLPHSLRFPIWTTQYAYTLDRVFSRHVIKTGSRHLGDTHCVCSDTTRLSSHEIVNYCRVFGCNNSSDPEKHMKYFRLHTLGRGVQ